MMQRDSEGILLILASLTKVLMKGAIMKPCFSLLTLLILLTFTLSPTFAQDLILTGHTEAVTSVAYSPDGKTLASGSQDNTIRLWDTHTGKHIRTLEGHTDIVNDISYSPDGKTLASGSQDNTIRLWDTHTGKHIRTLEEDGWHVLAVSYSRDGKTIASSSLITPVFLWDAHTGERIRKFRGFTDSVLSIEYSLDGKTLATVGSDRGVVNLWNIQTGREHPLSDEILNSDVPTVRHEIVDHENGRSPRVRSVAYSPDGHILASGGSDKTIRLWHARTLVHIQTLEGHTGEVCSVAYSPDGKTLASGSQDNTIRLWDTHIGKHIRTLEGHTGEVCSVAYSPDGKTLASGSQDKIVRIWKIPNDKDSK